jgi:ADP-ribose pyrophosphatase
MNTIVSLHAGKHLELVRSGKWEFVRRQKASAVVCIVAITSAHEIVLVQQQRIPVGRSVIELPAGLVGDEDAEENILDAANRELSEETGFFAGKLSILTIGPSSAGLTNELVTLIKAEDLKRVGLGGGVAGENIIVHTIPLATAPGWLADKAAEGHLIDHKVWAALWFSFPPR